MPFRFDEFVALVKAGYTKEEIDAMEAAEEAAQVEKKTEQTPAEEKKPEPVEVRKDTPAPTPEIPADTRLEALQAEIVALRQAIQAMNRSNAYRTDDPGAVTAESILASIIQPTKNER